jgi:TolA-binding protein
MADEIQEDDLPAEPIELSRFDMHSAWRVLLWGASAAMAVAIVAGTAFSDIGAERLKQTVAALWQPSNTETQPAAQPVQIAQHPPAATSEQIAALEKQTRELAQTVRDLTADRDRMRAKLASVEQNLGDITGTIRKQTEQAGQFAAQLAAQTAALTAPRPQIATASPPPVVSTPQAIAAIPSPVATPATAAIDTPITTATTPPAVEASPPIDGPIPLPPMRTAAIEENAATVRELGVDVGGAPSLDALHAHWVGLKANAGPDIVGLTPSFAVRPRPAGGNDYRLVLGPFPNTTAALRLCTKLIAARINCRAGTFSVQRLASAAPAPAVRSSERLPPASRDPILSR